MQARWRVGSDSDDEHRMRKATKEAKAAVKDSTEEALSAGRRSAGWASSGHINRALGISSQQAPTGQPTMPRELVCWNLLSLCCCPRRQLMCVLVGVLWCAVGERVERDVN